MVLTAMENLIDELKAEESLEFARREHDHLTTDELIISYQKSDRARWTLNKIYDNLMVVINENSRTDDGSEDTRSDEQKQTHQQCFGFLSQIGQRRI